MGTHGEYGTARQRDEYGGLNWGAAFFGWLVAAGIGTLLTGLLATAGPAIEISGIDSVTEADEVGTAGALLMLGIILIAYFAGGYVAGRMSRFDGGRQGLGVWAWGLVVAGGLTIGGALAGPDYSLFEISLADGAVVAGGVIVLALVLIGTLLAAAAGGTVGIGYHRRVDALDDAPVAAFATARDGDSGDDPTEHVELGEPAEVPAGDRDGDDVDEPDDWGDGLAEHVARDEPADAGAGGRDGDGDPTERIAITEPVEAAADERRLKRAVDTTELTALSERIQRAVEERRAPERRA